MNTKETAVEPIRPEPKPAEMRSPWTPLELDMLRQLYPNNSNDAVAELIGRSVSAIAHKAHRLHLRKSAEFNASVQSGRFTAKREGLLRRLFKSLFKC